MEFQFRMCQRLKADLLLDFTLLGSHGHVEHQSSYERGSYLSHDLVIQAVEKSWYGWNYSGLESFHVVCEIFDVAGKEANGPSDEKHCTLGR